MKIRINKYLIMFLITILAIFSIELIESNKAYAYSTVQKWPLSSCQVSLEYTSCIYDGTQKKPKVKSITTGDGKHTMTSGYIVTYGTNKSIGSGSVTITAKSNASYITGSVTKYFKILDPKTNSNSNGKPPTVKTNINKTLVTRQWAWAYTGKAIKPPFNVTYNGYTLKNGSDYVYEYQNNINVGMGMIIIMGRGMFFGTNVIYFEINNSNSGSNNSKSISNSTVTLSQTSYVYDGTEKKPTVTVSYNGKTLKHGTDYTIAYKNNVKIGTANVYIYGKGKYNSSKTVTFKINPRDISKCKISLNPSTYTYDGTSKKPTVIVQEAGGKSLTAGTHYTIKYYNVVNAGTGTVEITGKGIYSGTKKATFTINQKLITECTISLSKTTFTYDGTEKKPTITVKNGSKKLVAGTDYTIKFDSNRKDVGTINIQIIGKGNYKGSVTKQYTITTANISNLNVSIQKQYTYTGEMVEPKITIKQNSRTLQYGKDYTYNIYNGGVKVGKAKVQIQGKGNYFGTINKEINIVAASIKDCQIALTGTKCIYNGKKQEPTSIIAMYLNKRLTKNDYEITKYTNNINAGKAEITIKGKGNFKDSTIINFTIEPMDIAKITSTDIQVASTGYQVTHIPGYRSDKIVYNEPSVTIKNPVGRENLRKGNDFVISYYDQYPNQNSKMKVEITGKGNFTGTITKNIIVKQNECVLPFESSGTQGTIPSLTDGFRSSRGNGDHTGIDIAGDYGSMILSMKEGKVVFAGRVTDPDAFGYGYGKFVVVEHTESDGSKIYTLYAHLGEIDVTEGQNLNAGEQLGIQGNTGHSSGDHLHFEVINSNGDYVDPTAYLFGQSGEEQESFKKTDPITNEEINPLDELGIGNH